MAKNSRFLKEIRRTEKAVDSIAVRLELSLTRYVSSLIEEYLLSDNQTDREYILALLRSSNAPAGLLPVLEEIDMLYRVEFDNLSSRFTLDQDDVDLGREVVNGEQANLRANTVQALTKLSTAVALGAVTTAGAAVASVVPSLTKTTSATLHTNVAGFRSALEVRKASQVDPEPLFAYIGPDDSKTRELCRKILRKNKLYTLAEIAELDRDPLVQIEPVLIYGGGYNCRHRWIYTKRR